MGCGRSALFAPVGRVEDGFGVLAGEQDEPIRPDVSKSEDSDELYELFLVC